MANYDRLALTEPEMRELGLFQRIFPFRQWFVVKALNNEARFFDSRRKALNYARKHFNPEFETVRMYEPQKG